MNDEYICRPSAAHNAAETGGGGGRGGGGGLQRGLCPGPRPQDPRRQRRQRLLRHAVRRVDAEAGPGGGLLRGLGDGDTEDASEDARQWRRRQ